MGVAHVTKFENVVKEDGWEGVTHFLSTGFLAAFTKVDTGIRYVYCEDDDFNGQHGGHFLRGYYPQDDFLKYLVQPSRAKDYSLLDSKNKYYDKFVPAQAEDIYEVRRLEVSDEGVNSSPIIKSYPIAYYPENKVIEKVWSGSKFINKEVWIPIGVLGVQVNISSNPALVNFVVNHRTILWLGSGVAPSDKEAGLIKLGQIALIIKGIIGNVFSKFPDETAFNTIRQTQLDQWGSVDSVLFNENTTLQEYEDYRSNLSVFYRAAYRRSGLFQLESKHKVYLFMLGLSFKSLSVLTPESRIAALDYLINNDMLSLYFEKLTMENFVIKILNSFAQTLNIDNINAITAWLQTKRENGGSRSTTNYQFLYDRMSTDLNITAGTVALHNWLFEYTWETDDTKGDFAKVVYKLWIGSKYNPYVEDPPHNLKPNSMGMKTLVGNVPQYELEPEEDHPEDEPVITSVNPPVPGKLYYYTKYPASVKKNVDVVGDDNAPYEYNEEVNLDAAPLVIPYESQKFAGIYFDNFRFSFNNSKIVAKIEMEFKHPGIEEDDYEPEEGTEHVLFGSYHIFQPVSLLYSDTADVQTKMPIPLTTGQAMDGTGSNINSLVPVFMLHHIDTAGDRSDFEKALGYTLDGILTFTGIGNITKYRHVVVLSGLQRAKRIIGFVEFTSGIISFLSGFVECNNDSDFCKGIKVFLFWLEMASLSADAITTQMLRKSANNLKNTQYPPDFNNAEVIEKIDQLADGIDFAYEVSKYLDSVEISTGLRAAIDALPHDRAKYDLIGYMRKDDNIRKILNDNPDFLDGLDSLDELENIRKVRRLGRSMEIFSRIRKRVDNEPFSAATNRGLSFKKHIQDGDKWIETTELLHSDQDILEMIQYGIDLNPRITDKNIEGILEKAFRVKKPRSKADIIGNGDAIPDPFPDLISNPFPTGIPETPTPAQVQQWQDYLEQRMQLQEVLGQFGVASISRSRIPPGLLHCFNDLAHFEQLQDVIRGNYIERFNLQIVKDNVFIGGTANTKLLAPDIDVVVYLSDGQAKAIMEQSIKNLENALANTNLIIQRESAKKLIDKLETKIKIGNFKIKASDIIAIENGRIVTMSSSKYKNPMQEMLDSMNIPARSSINGDDRFDIVFKSLEDAVAKGFDPPEVKVNL